MASAYELRRAAERRYDGPIPLEELHAIAAQARREVRAAVLAGPSPADLRWRLSQARFQAALARAEIRLCCRGLRACRRRRDHATMTWQREFARREVHRLLAGLSDLFGEWQACRQTIRKIQIALEQSPAGLRARE